MYSDSGGMLEIPGEHQAHISSEIVGIIAEAIGVFAIGEIENIVGCEKNVEVMSIAHHEVGAQLCTPKLIGRWGVVNQVGFCIKSCLFGHEAMRHFRVDVVEMSEVSEVIS